MMRSAALILAKKASSRLPNKNTRDFHGKPMFLVNVEKCLRIFSDVFVSSDSDWILDVAEKAGAKGIKRGPELCGDTPNIPVYQHALRKMGHCDVVVAVQANSPTVNSNLIALAKRIMEMELGIEEIMTCDNERNIYGSIWALTKDRIVNYGDPYDPHPNILLFDSSVDIHNDVDLQKALCQ